MFPVRVKLLIGWPTLHPFTNDTEVGIRRPFAAILGLNPKAPGRGSIPITILLSDCEPGA